MKMITAAVLFACATHANAWDGQATGPIEQIEVGTVVADGIAVYRSGVRVMCNKGPEYAVLGENDKNAKAISAILMSSKMIGEPVIRKSDRRADADNGDFEVTPPATRD